MEHCPWTPPGTCSGPLGQMHTVSTACHYDASSEAQSSSLVCPSGRMLCPPVHFPSWNSLLTPLDMQHYAVDLSIAVSVSVTLKIDRCHTTDLVRFTHICKMKMILGERLCICGCSLLEIRFNRQHQIICNQALAWFLEQKVTRPRPRDYLLSQTWERLHWTSRHAHLVCSHCNDHFWLSLWLM